MTLFSHSLFASSYNEQFLNVMETADIDHLLDELELEALNGFGISLGIPISSQISETVYYSFCIRVSSLLDGQLNRLTAEKCRRAYNLIYIYYPNINELQAIYEHLREHYKGTRNPMPLQKR